MKSLPSRARIHARLSRTIAHHAARSLAPEATAEGVRRLGWLGVVYAGAILVSQFGSRMLSMLTGGAGSGHFGVPESASLASIAMGLAISALVWRGGLSSKRLLDLGLVFQVAGALGIAVREFWYGLPSAPAGSAFFPAPTECVWLVAYPLVVPNTPRKILIASLLAASMGPFALALSAVVTSVPVRPVAAATYFLTSSYMFAIVAYMIARVIHRFSVHLQDAREIGSYQLIERIGEGGMGEVWSAEHRLLARRAAIKLIRSDKLGETLRAREDLTRRFEREARDTAALRSIHTIDVYDFGVTEEGDFYYVMELLDGLSLERLVVDHGPVDPARTVYFLRQVCHSLAEAHARGFVHRDVKPTNIFVCRLGPDVDFVKVLDFGLVKHAAGAETVSMLTMDGAAAGTPGYMAPEVALGQGNVDGRADVYSVGCVAYYLLTGRPVFLGDTPVARALAHVRDEPKPPSMASEFHVSEALDAVILECLAKDPARRPASAAALSELLAAAVTGPSWTPEAAHAWWDRHQPLARDARGAGSAREPAIAPTGARFRPRLDRRAVQTGSR